MISMCYIMYAELTISHTNRSDIFRYKYNGNILVNMGNISVMYYTLWRHIRVQDNTKIICPDSIKCWKSSHKDRMDHHKIYKVLDHMEYYRCKTYIIRSGVLDTLDEFVLVPFLRNNIVRNWVYASINGINMPLLWYILKNKIAYMETCFYDISLKFPHVEKFLRDCGYIAYMNYCDYKRCWKRLRRIHFESSWT